MPDLPENITLEPMPFEEAIAFFGDKLAMTADKFYDLTEEMRAKAFTVARVSSMDVLMDIHTAVERAIDAGETLADFKGRLSDIMAARGWEGLTPWHAETVFRNNIQTAYSVGRWNQMQDMADRFYGEYDAVNDSRTRPTHAALDGKIFPLDHPFWDTWWPPNGHRCFPPWIKVRTPLGWEEIGTICSQDRIIAGGGKEQLVKSVHANMFNGRLVRLECEGFRIDTTPNHRILTMRGWIRADRINMEDILIETLPLPMINTAIGNIDHPDSQFRDGRMATPVQGKPANIFTTDGQIKSGEKKIEPFRTHCSRYNMIMNRIIALAEKMLQQFIFSPGGKHLAGCMFQRIATNKKLFRNSGFCAHLGPKHRRGLFKSIRNSFNRNIIFLGLSQIRMALFDFYAPGKFTHQSSGFFTPFFGRIQPLSAYGIASSARLNIIMPHQSHQRAGIYPPARAELPIRKLLFDIETRKTLGDGDFLDCFDTINDFRAWARSHCVLRKIDFIDCIPYTGIVVNLSVDTDRSFIVKGATVHNCRCSVNPMHKYAVEEEGLTVETDDPTNTLIEPKDPVTGMRMPARHLIPDPGWNHHPAKTDWQPNLSKYPEELKKQYYADVRTQNR